MRGRLAGAKSYKKWVIVPCRLEKWAGNMAAMIKGEGVHRDISRTNHENLALAKVFWTRCLLVFQIF